MKSSPIVIRAYYSPHQSYLLLPYDLLNKKTVFQITSNHFKFSSKGFCLQIENLITNLRFILESEDYPLDIFPELAFLNTPFLSKAQIQYQFLLTKTIKPYYIPSPLSKFYISSSNSRILCFNNLPIPIFQENNFIYNFFLPIPKKHLKIPFSYINSYFSKFHKESYSFHNMKNNSTISSKCKNFHQINMNISVLDLLNQKSFLFEQ